MLENSPKCEEVPSDVVAELPVACPSSKSNKQWSKISTLSLAQKYCKKLRCLKIDPNVKKFRQNHAKLLHTIHSF